MRSFNKLTALLLALVLCLGCLAACGEGKNKGQGGDAIETGSDKYVANIRMRFASNDAEMKEAIRSLNSSYATLKVDGDKTELLTYVSVGSVSVNDSYLLIDGVLYHSSSATDGEYSVTVKEKAAMSEADRGDILSSYSVGAVINIGDFLTHDIQTSGDRTIYNCSDVTEQAREGLTALFVEGFEGMGASVETDRVVYALETVGNLNDCSVLSVDYVVNMDDKLYTVTMHLYYSYDYEAEVKISAPEDKDAYTETSAKDIIG